LALAGLAIYAVAGKTDELSGASTFLNHLQWWWGAAAVVVEAVSYVSFAATQRRLLAAGEVAMPIGTMTGITVASNALGNSLPAGVVISAAYTFRQFRRFGADDVLSGWVVVATAAVSFITLAAMAAVGLTLAASTGSEFDLVSAILGVAVVAALVVACWAKRTFVVAKSEGPVRLFQRYFHRPKGDARQAVIDAGLRLSWVAPSKREWASASTYAMGNWVLDLGCLVFSFLAVGSGVPWKGLLLAYAAGQLASNLPITPGGLGVVEGSLTVALVAFGGGQVGTVAAVLLYRLISFWAMLPIGYASWGVLAARTRRRPELVPGPPLVPLPPEAMLLTDLPPQYLHVGEIPLDQAALHVAAGAGAEGAGAAPLEGSSAEGSSPNAGSSEGEALGGGSSGGESSGGESSGGESSAGAPPDGEAP
jgi:putative heme transporter